MINLKELKEIVCRQNKRLKEENLVILTWGNVSQITKDRKYVVIKPSGVSYDKLYSDDMAVVDIDGNQIEGKLKPSVDTSIHLEIYKKFPEIFGICHAHSSFATMFAQANEEIPCYGTTHADYFSGSVPVARDLTDKEIELDYERNLAKSIIEVMDHKIPAVLAAGHAPFTFGVSAQDAVDNMQVLEQISMMAILKEPKNVLNKKLLEKHFYRKHGPGHYYGQN